MQIFDITIAANQARQLEAAGTYFYFYAGSAGGADSTILLKEDAKGTTIQLKPGQAFRLPAGSRQATRWSIQNFANAATITGQVVIGDGEITDNRVTGVVEVVDGELQKSKAGIAFVTAWGPNAVGGQYAIIELWNPAGSGRRCIVSDLQFSASSAAAYALVRSSAMVSATVGAPSKSNLGGVSQTKCNGYNSATFPIGPILEQCIAAQAIQRAFKQPYIIEPNSGLAFFNSSIGLNLYGSVQFTEEAI